jgi:hypothetical protein
MKREMAFSDEPTNQAPTYNFTRTRTRQQPPPQEEEIHQHKKSLLLSVPFYVYDNLAWVNATWGGMPVREAALTVAAKHSDDYWFLQASLRHPMRTRDIANAKLFVIPTLQNLFFHRLEPGHGHGDLCWKGLCNERLMEYAGTVLESSRSFQEYPDRHLAVTSQWAYEVGHFKLKMPASLANVLFQSHAITFEQRQYNSPQRLQFPSYYVGRRCPLSEEKIYDVAIIASLHHHDHRNGHEDRRSICEWLMTNLSKQESMMMVDKKNNNSSSTATTIRIPFCGQGKQCPVLAQSKFGIHVRGDTFGSNRLMDTILSGTIPIFTRREQYDIVPSWIDWKQFSYFIDMENATQTSFLASLTELVYDKAGDYHEKYQALMEHRHLFDWTTLYPFDTYMYMLQAELYPDTRRDPTTSPWSGLALPPQNPTIEPWLSIGNQPPPSTSTSTTAR